MAVMSCVILLYAEIRHMPNECMCSPYAVSHLISWMTAIYVSISHSNVNKEDRWEKKACYAASCITTDILGHCFDVVSLGKAINHQLPHLTQVEMSTW